MIWKKATIDDKEILIGKKLLAKFNVQIDEIEEKLTAVLSGY